jgi:spore maturation protein SpmB
MAASDFFSNNGVTRFINRMAALLQISDTSRIKVVGVYTGSIDVAVIIIPVITPIAASNTTNMTG